MDQDRSGTAWCWAGLATVGLLGISLAEARELFSETETLAVWDAGTWITLTAFGIEDVRWAFRITPLSAWWGMAIGGMLSLVGWAADRGTVRLPFGWLGGWIWLTTLAALFAENLLLAWLLASVSALACGFWLAAQGQSAESGSDLRAWQRSVLIGGTIGLWGLLAAGLAWGTFSCTDLASVEFIQTGWLTRSGLCGLAGTGLYLGALGQGALFPFFRGTRVAGQFRGHAVALVFSVCLWPGWLWFLFRARWIFGCAPETVALMQGLSLLAAVMAAFTATGQACCGRTIALLATGQFGMLLSVLAIPDASSAVWVSLITIALSLSSALLFVAQDRSMTTRGATGFAWFVLAGACLTPLFWMSTAAVERFQQAPATVIAAERPPADSEIASADPTAEDSYRVRPLPVPTWTAMWCLFAFFSAFAGWRGWKSSEGEKESAREGENKPLSHSHSLTLSFLLAAALLTVAVGSAWFALRGGYDSIHWPALAATLAGGAGWLVSWWVCRDPAQAEARFQRLGSWPDLARRDLGFDEMMSAVQARSLSYLLELSQSIEEKLRPGRSSGLEAGLAQRFVHVVEELRSEPAVFYAGALGLTIGSLLITWLTLSG